MSHLKDPKIFQEFQHWNIKGLISEWSLCPQFNKLMTKGLTNQILESKAWIRKFLQRLRTLDFLSLIFINFSKCKSLKANIKRITQILDSQTKVNSYQQKLVPDEKLQKQIQLKPTSKQLNKVSETHFKSSLTQGFLEIKAWTSKTNLQKRSTLLFIMQWKKDEWRQLNIFVKKE